MSTKILIVFVVCLIAICYAQTPTTTVKQVNPSPTTVANMMSQSMTTVKPGNMSSTPTSAAMSLTAPVVLIVSALALLC